MFKKNKKLTLFLFALIFIGSTLFFAQPAHACSIFNPIECLTTFGLVWLLSKLMYVIGFLAGIVFSFGGFLIDLALELNSKVAALPMVLSGWKIVLNLTNLAFVLGIIWIAIATIIRSQGYGYKQILWKLIVAAVMVNFSLVISGFFLDFSGIITDFFVDKASPTIGKNTLSFSSELGASLQPQQALSISATGATIADFQKKVGGTLALDATAANTEDVNDLAAALNLLVNLVFGVFFTVIGGIVFLGIAVMLLVRFVFIAILLVLAPIVWLGWVFPALGKYWTEWWGNFIKWTFFPPITTFFLYLAITTALGKSKFVTGAAAIVDINKSGAAGAAIKGLMFQGLDNMAQNLLVIALMIGGLIAAERSGIAFAGAFKGAALKVGKWTADKAKSGALFAKNRATLGLQDRAKTWTENINKGDTKGLRAAAQRLVIGQVVGARKQERENIDAKVKEQLDIPKELRIQRQVARAIVTEQDRVADDLVLTKDKTTSPEILKEKLNGAARDRAEKYGYKQDIVKANRLVDNNKDNNIEEAYTNLTNAEKGGTPAEIAAAGAELEKRLVKLFEGFRANDFSESRWISAMEAGSREYTAAAKALAKTATPDSLNRVLQSFKSADQLRFSNVVLRAGPAQKSLTNYLENGIGQIGSSETGISPTPTVPTPPSGGGKP